MSIRSSAAVKLAGDFPYIYFVDTEREQSSIRVGWSSGGPGRLRDHAKYGYKLLAAMPGSKDYEARIHRHFTEIGRLAGTDSSTYFGDEIRTYVEALLSKGLAAGSLEDAAHLNTCAWSTLEPGRVMAMDRGTDAAGQVVMFEAHATKRAEHAASVAYHASESDEWYTPKHIIESARVVLGSIDTDPASCPPANQFVRANVYWSQRQSGLDLTHEWRGNVWMNPPYGGLAQLFVERLFRELDSGTVNAAIVLLNLNAMSAKWFQPVTARADALLITNGRLPFMKGTDEQGFSSPATGSVLAYFGPDSARFRDEFCRYGHVLVTWGKRATKP